MNRDVLSYLADLALVRQQISNVLGIGRGIIDQKTLHHVSAKSAVLDKLFVSVLSSGKIPGESGVANPFQEEEYVDINERLRQAKAELNQKTTPKVEEVEYVEPTVKKNTRKTPIERPSEEVEAFQKLLSEAESQVKAPVKKTRKKTTSKNK